MERCCFISSESNGEEKQDVFPHHFFVSTDFRDGAVTEN